MQFLLLRRHQPRVMDNETFEEARVREDMIGEPGDSCRKA